jgi:3-hydroxyacyl-CoA dehydrogenase/enoyl-CoA hydratase/3-hydroxybutyryl-CoA epimerase
MQSNWTTETDDDNIVWLGFDKAGTGTNTLSAEAMRELDKRLEAIEQHTPRAVVVYSAKKSGFVAGADIKEFTELKTPQQAFEMIRRGQLVLDRLNKLACPTIAMIDGFALGGGLELALACRYRVAAETIRTSFGFPEVKLGIHPGFGGTVRSVRLVGVEQAMNLMLTGHTADARKAAKIGLVDKLAPPDRLRETTRELALNPPSPTEAPLSQRVLNLAPARAFVAKTIRERTAHKVNPKHYPAPFAMIDLWRKHGANPKTQYLEEAHSIANLMCGQTARNLVRVFFLQNRLKSLGKKKGVEIKRVHVVGAGTMGGDIAAWCAYKGLDASLQDLEEKYVKSALARARKLFEKKIDDPNEVRQTTERLKADVPGNTAADADLVIEAIIENVEAKQSLYKDLEQTIRPDAVLATNTSSIRLETLAEALSEPARLVGLHFFNPVAKMPLIEVIYREGTDQAVIDKALAFTRLISRLPVPVKSSPGFLVNRILMPYLMEAMLMVGEGMSPERIDKAAVDFGMPMGPIELADTVGLDVCLSVAKIFSQEFDRKIPEQLTERVEAGKLGRKSGEGFYRYNDEGKPIKDETKANGASDDLQDRLILPMLNEAVAVLRAGIVEDAELLDAGVIFGTGFAPFRGGPIQYIRNSGAEKLRSRLEDLKTRHGERFQPDEGWSSLETLKKDQGSPAS